MYVHVYIYIYRHEHALKAVYEMPRKKMFFGWEMSKFVEVKK